MSALLAVSRLAAISLISLVLLFDAKAEQNEGNSRVELVGPGVISTDRNETFPAEDPIDGSMWFSVDDRSFGAQIIMHAKNAASGWATPEVASFSGEYGDRAPRFSPDATSLFFTSNRPREEGGSRGDMNIWRVERNGESWSNPILLDAPINSDASEIHTSITLDAIWFTSNRAGGRGRSDLYRFGKDGILTHLE